MMKVNISCMGGNKWQARAVGEEGIDAVGRTPEEALGGLVRQHPQNFPLLVNWEAGEFA